MDSKQAEKIAGDGSGAPILVTGGAGFIGSNFVLEWMAAGKGPLVNLDKLTYAGNPENLASVADNPAYTFVHGDICDAELVAKLLDRTPAARDACTLRRRAMSTARSWGRRRFCKTNIDGTFTLLQAAQDYYDTLEGEEKDKLSLSACLDRRGLRHA